MRIEFDGGPKTLSAKIEAFNDDVGKLESEKSKLLKAPVELVESMLGEADAIDSFSSCRDAILTARMKHLHRESLLWQQRAEILNSWIEYATKKLAKLRSDFEKTKTETAEQMTLAGAGVESQQAYRVTGRPSQSATRQFEFQVERSTVVTAAKRKVNVLSGNIDTARKQIKTAIDNSNACKQDLRTLAEKHLLV